MLSAPAPYVQAMTAIRVVYEDRDHEVLAALVEAVLRSGTGRRAI
jgi:hypothetical protein